MDVGLFLGELAGTKRVGNKTPEQQQQAVVRLFARYKASIQPNAHLCPTDKILARLARFSEAELAQGIDHFAAEQWWMEHCACRGATWFFDNDARSEQFLLLAHTQGGNHMDIGVFVGEFARSLVVLAASLALLLGVVRLVPRRFRLLRLSILPWVWGLGTVWLTSGWIAR